MRKTTSDKPRLRMVWQHVLGRDFPVWQATFKGHTVTNVRPVLAYCEVLEKARKGF